MSSQGLRFFRYRCSLTNGYSFRWVECQFESLKRCPRSESHLDHCLRSLPRTLDETYERMLCNIDEGLTEEARQILTLLCFSSRPLTVAELIDGIAVDLNEPAGLDPRRRLQDVDDLLEICPGLIDIKAEAADEMLSMTDEDTKIENETPVVRIAHFSVQEYLESDRIKQQRAMAFGLSHASAHTQIAQIFLVYLQEPSLSSGNLDQTKLEEFPLARFAARSWFHHFNKADRKSPLLDNLALRLFQDRQRSFSTWVRLHDVDGPRGDFQPNLSDIASPLYYASFLGLERIVCGLLNFCQNNTADTQDLVNVQGGFFGNALQAASSEGHDKVVQMLLDAGADVNAQGGDYGNALQAASSFGHETVVRKLLAAGAVDQEDRAE